MKTKERQIQKKNKKRSKRKSLKLSLQSSVVYLHLLHSQGFEVLHSVLSLKRQVKVKQINHYLVFLRYKEEVFSGKFLHQEVYSQNKESNKNQVHYSGLIQLLQLQALSLVLPILRLVYLVPKIPLKALLFSPISNPPHRLVKHQGQSLIIRMQVQFLEIPPLSLLRLLQKLVAKQLMEIMKIKVQTKNNKMRMTYIKILMPRIIIIMSQSQLNSPLNRSPLRKAPMTRSFL